MKARIEYLEDKLKRMRDGTYILSEAEHQS